MELISVFTWADYLVVAVVLIVSAAVGLYYACTGGKQTTTKEYLLADRSAHWFPVAASLVSSYISTQTMIGTPAEIYSHGTIYGYIVLCIPVAGIVAHTLYLPVFKTLNVTSIYELTKLRFGREMTVISMLIGVVGLLLRSTLVIYGPSLAFSQVTGVDLWLSVLLLTMVSVTYTVLGGLKAVLWADALQFLVMAGGFLAILIAGIIKQEGLANIWEANKRSGRLDFLDAEKVFALDPRVRHTIWTQFFGGLLLWSSNLGSTQSTVQRALALRSRRDSLIAYSFASIGLTAFTLVGILLGLVIFSYFKYCDPISAHLVAAGDQLYPLFVMELFGKYPGLGGLILSSVFSASLSTVSTAMNSISTVVLQDIIRPLKPGLSERTATLASKIICICCGCTVIGLAAFTKYFGQGILTMGLAFAGMTGGPNIAVFALGVLNPIANRKGTLIGFFVAVLFISWKGMGGIVHSPHVYKYPVTTAGCNVTDPTAMANITAPVYDPLMYNPSSHYRSGINSFYDVSYAWNGIWGFMTTFVIATIFSIILRREGDPKVHKDLLSPIIQKAIPFLPKSVKENIELEGSAWDQIDSAEKTEEENELKEVNI